ncbi:LLM class F420-dependent oxidoreductase [Amycolatopsis sp. NPDC059027]|uniref:LLM class F420-dependent oxidoreductase n=1 Tax=Amycolatopsis sp. NPDC059027 TaxID=3346709 RepID=UPI003670B23E
MTIGVTLPAGENPSPHNTVDELITQAHQAADAGLGSVWFSQLFGYDAISLAGLAGREVPDIEIGTSVVPIYPRHPLLVAALAQTAQAAVGGRFTLGIGLGAKEFLEPVYGLPYAPPIRHLREYLTVLRTVFAGEEPRFDGETFAARPPFPAVLPGATETSVIVAALGPQALRVTGELADGTLTFLAGPKALSTLIAPVLTEAASKAGRPAPRVIAAVSAVVTDDVDAVRANALEKLAFYGDLPSYRRLLDAEGVSHGADLTLIGDEATVEAGIRRYFEAGATEIVASQTGLGSAEDRLRTWKFLGELKSRL